MEGQCQGAQLDRHSVVTQLVEQSVADVGMQLLPKAGWRHECLQACRMSPYIRIRKCKGGTIVLVRT